MTGGLVAAGAAATDPATTDPAGDAADAGDAAYVPVAARARAAAARPAPWRERSRGRPLLCRRYMAIPKSSSVDCAGRASFAAVSAKEETIMFRYMNNDYVGECGPR